jgi:hypothetical protein
MKKNKPIDLNEIELEGFLKGTKTNEFLSQANKYGTDPQAHMA